MNEKPHREAIVDEKSRLTFAQLGSTVQRLAIALHELGIKKQDRVIVQLPNCVEFIVCFLAVSHAGGVSVPVIPQFRKKDISYLLKLTEAVAIVIPDTFHSFDYPQMVSELRSEAPSLKHVIVVGQQAPRDMLSFTSLLDARGGTTPPADVLAKLRPDAVEVAFISLTGGTTGFPKGVPHTHDDFVGNRLEFLKAAGWGTNTVALIMMPPGVRWPYWELERLWRGYQ